MWRYEKDVLIGFGLLCLLGSALTGRARQALWRMGHSNLGAREVRTRVRPSGVLGALVGRAAVAEVRAVHGVVSGWNLRYDDGSCLTARARVVRLVWDDATIMGLAGCAVTITVRDVVLNGEALLARGEVVLVAHSGGDAEVTVPETALAQLVRQRLPGTENVQVALTRDGVRVRAAIANGSQSVEASALFEIRAGRAVYLQTPEILLNGGPVPPTLAQALAAGLNPVFRLEDVPGLAEACVLTEARGVENSLQLRLRVLARPRINRSKD